MIVAATAATQLTPKPALRTILITGSRHWRSYRRIEDIIVHLKPDLIIVGDCKTGADAMARRAARALNIPLHKKDGEVAQWHVYGLAAGPIRNRVMLDMKPSMVVAFHENLAESKGTKDCYEEANRRGMSTMLVTD